MTIGSSYSEPIANKFQNSDWTGQLNFDGPIFQNFRGTNNALISSWMVDDQLIAPFNPNHSLHNREPPKSIKLNATRPLESVLPWTSSIKSIETGHDWFCMKPRSFNQIQFILIQLQTNHWCLEKVLKITFSFSRLVETRNKPCHINFQEYPVLQHACFVWCFCLFQFINVLSTLMEKSS